MKKARGVAKADAGAGKKKSQESSVTLSVITEQIFHEMINKVRI